MEGNLFIGEVELIRSARYNRIPKNRRVVHYGISGIMLCHTREHKQGSVVFTGNSSMVTCDLCKRRARVVTTGTKTCIKCGLKFDEILNFQAYICRQCTSKYRKVNFYKRPLDERSLGYKKKWAKLIENTDRHKEYVLRQRARRRKFRENLTGHKKEEYYAREKRNRQRSLARASEETLLHRKRCGKIWHDKNYKKNSYEIQEKAFIKRRLDSLGLNVCQVEENIINNLKIIYSLERLVRERERKKTA